MGDGSGDLQSVWHIYVGQNIIHDSTILDLGSGLGKSKERLAVSNNIVATQDIERSRMKNVDFIAQPASFLANSYDYVTAFDVIEHATNPADFLFHCWRISIKGYFLTTPNKLIYDHPWHWTPEDFIEFTTHAFNLGPIRLEYFLRDKKPTGEDQILKVSESEFLENKTYIQYGVFYAKN